MTLLRALTVALAVAGSLALAFLLPTSSLPGGLALAQGPGVSIALFSDGFGAQPAPGFYRAAAMAPDLAIWLGDMDHRNPSNLAAIRRMHQEMLHGGCPLGDDWVASGLSSIPFLAVWDDHDYCRNDASKYCPSRAAAMQAWREYHAFAEDNGYPLGIWQRAVVGAVELYGHAE